ncbi:tetratricopeptide repeat protein [Breznakiella homolactica]|uniref:Tetratricopeptide repeat protein n=1 Tax=Breznakiella homolactica TaxID=2798577 RepID=A0A7T7XMY2_9SPIR|nr:tetratricopeptide repeat protein [Breznakiella homolactica]QQO09222.1 tetratricopeptide repeat protein [Breznakiella homolactica]
MRIFKLACIALLAACIIGCASGPVEVPADMSPAKIIQQAQEASDRNKFDQAIQYYEILRERYPNDIEHVVTAEYEIAFLHYKQKKYDQAQGELQELLSRYDSPDAVLLPPQYKILAETVLTTIETKLAEK